MLLLNYGLIKVNLGPFFGLSYGPLILLYTEALIFAEWKFKKSMALQFLPALVGAVALIFFPELLFKPTINLVVTFSIILHLAVYLFVSYKRVSWFQRSLKNLQSDVVAGNLAWLKFLILSIAVLFCIVLIEAIIFQNQYLDELVTLVIYLFVLVFLNRINNRGLKQPEIFFGITKQHEALAREIENKYSSSSLTEAEALAYKEELLAYMAEKEPFLQFQLSLADIANETNIPSRHLSQILNDRFDKNFFDFVNGYRIERAQSLLADPKSDLRINEVMYDAGFNSKSTFNFVFKKAIGCTPTEYRNKFKINKKN